MRVILFHGPRFAFRAHHRVLEEVAEDMRAGEVHEAVTAFIHVQPKDVEREAQVATRLVKNIKWLAGKLASERVVLHSFSHLDTEAAPAEVAWRILSAARARLERVGYAVEVTPFGHICEIELSVGGQSLQRVYKEL